MPLAFVRLLNAARRLIPLRHWRSTISWWLVIPIVCTAGVGSVLLISWEWLRGEDSPSTTIGNVGLLVAAIWALPLAIWRSRVAERQAETAQKALLNERYQTATEMLGNPLLPVRLGGIYALQNLAEERPETYHVQIMRLLCAYIRGSVPEQGSSVEIPGILVGCPTGIEDRQIAEDVAAIMEVIRDRDRSRIQLERKVEFKLDLHGADLRAARLDGADLSGALLWEANLSCSPETLINATRLDGADLTGANFVRADLSNANLRGAKLRRAVLARTNLIRTQLHTSDLTGADLTGAIVSGAVFADGVCRVDCDGKPLTTRLTQTQLDDSRADPDNPPNVDGLVDVETGEPIVWNHRVCD